MKKNIIVLSACLLLLIKSFGFHLFSHLNNEENHKHCDVCLLTIAINETPPLEAKIISFEVSQHNFLEKKLNTIFSSVDYSNQHLLSFLFTRPPPTIL